MVSQFVEKVWPQKLSSTGIKIFIGREIIFTSLQRIIRGKGQILLYKDRVFYK